MFLQSDSLMQSTLYMCENAKIVNVVYCMCISENTIIRSNGWPASSVEVFSTSRNWRENDGAS